MDLRKDSNFLGEDHQVLLKKMKKKHKKNHIVDVQDNFFFEDDEDIYFTQKRVFYVDDI